MLDHHSNTVYQSEIYRKRFWSRVDQSGGENACWLWTGGTDQNGYGVMQTCVDGRTRLYRAPRLALIFSTGSETPGLVCHKCHNPACCNPSHLYVGTPADNARDRTDGTTGWGKKVGAKRLAKERRRTPRPLTLSDDEWSAIRSIAEKAGCSPSRLVGEWATKAHGMTPED